MRSRRRRRVAVLLGILLVGAGLVLTPSPVVAAECPPPLTSCIVVSVVKTADGKKTVLKRYTVGPDDMKAWAAKDKDLQSRRYGLRKNPESRGGKLTQRASIARGSRVSINALLSYLDAVPSGKKATFLETPNASGIPAVLSDTDLATPPDAPEPEPTPTPSQTTTTSPSPTTPSPTSTPSAEDYPFIEGLPPAVFLAGNGQFGYIRPLRDDEDTNYSDYFRVAGRLDLTINTTGRLLEPAVTSSAGTSLDTKAKTTFSVSFSTKPNTRIKSTRWDFGDGTSKGTKRPEPSKTFAKRGTYPVVVSVRGDNGSYGRSAALQIKVANPPKAPRNSAGGGNGGGLGSTNDIPPPYDPYTDDLPEDLEAPDDTEDIPLEDDEPQIPVDDGLEPIEGYVLAGAEIVPGGTPESIPGTQDSTPAAASQESLRKRLAAWAVAALAVALFLGVGAVSETRWLHHRLRHLRRRT